jgi:ATP-dependent Clp protease ATP-binding subunit ClpA
VATLHVRNVPDELYEALRARADAVGRSIGAETIGILSQAMFEEHGGNLLRPRFGRRRMARPRPWERITGRARRALVLAQDEARGLGHNYLGTEHMLLGLFAEGVAARALALLGLSPDGVRAQVVEIVGRGDATAAGAMPFTPRSKKVLELALREALRLGHNYVGTEHILLGISSEGEGVAARILREAGADHDAVCSAVTRGLTQVPETTAAGGDAYWVVELEGTAAEWSKYLNEAAGNGGELVTIISERGKHRAVFRAV